MKAVCVALLGRYLLIHGFILDPQNSLVPPLVPVCSPVCKLALFTGELETDFRWLMNDSQILNIVVWYRNNPIFKYIFDTHTHTHTYTYIIIFYRDKDSPPVNVWCLKTFCVSYCASLWTLTIHSEHVQIRGQLVMARSPLLCGSWGWRSSPQVWWQLLFLLSHLACPFADTFKSFWWSQGERLTAVSLLCLYQVSAHYGQRKAAAPSSLRGQQVWVD